MPLLPSAFRVSTYSGSLRACGRAYGEEHAEAINIGLDTDTKLKASEWTYVEQCMRVPWRHRRSLDAIIDGTAAGSGRKYIEIARLFFEGYGAPRHCTAVAATREGSADGRPILGMNWDGMPSLYPWSRLLRIDADGWPRMLVYPSRPGQIVGAGINEHGMSLVWTSAASSLRRRFRHPRVGVPTYCHVAGILACRDCAEAIAMLKESPNAAGFIFLIADAKRNAWVVEAVPHHLAFIECRGAVGRANHLEDPGLVRLSRQRVPRSTGPQNTEARGRRIHRLVRENYGRIDRAVVESMLRDTHDRPGHTICRNRLGGDPCMTVDSFYLLPMKREFWIARGLPTRHAFERHEV